MSTVAMYWPGWLTCSACGLTDPGVKWHYHEGANWVQCGNVTRCWAVRRGESLGGKRWDVSKVPE